VAVSGNQLHFFISYAVASSPLGSSGNGTYGPPSGIESQSPRLRPFSSTPVCASKA
jgi:hypothetical protein